MKLTSNVHTHSTWCDGENTLAEMAQRAVDIGFCDLGFSSHSPTPFDTECPGVRDEAGYRQAVAEVQRELGGRLNILCGMEQDFYAPVDAAEYGYVIGSVHYIEDGTGGLASVDACPEQTQRMLEQGFGGDAMALLRCFYALSVESARKYRPTIVGHFDLVAKHNEGSRWFDEESPAYRSLALEAFDAVLDTVRAYDGMVEVNTGAMSRGCRSVPYPAAFMLKHAAQKKARLIISSDSHKTASLDGYFDEALELLRTCGVKSVAMLKNGLFEDVLI